MSDGWRAYPAGSGAATSRCCGSRESIFCPASRAGRLSNPCGRTSRYRPRQAAAASTAPATDWAPDAPWPRPFATPSARSSSATPLRCGTGCPRTRRAATGVRLDERRRRDCRQILDRLGACGFRRRRLGDDQRCRRSSLLRPHPGQAQSGRASRRRRRRTSGAGHRAAACAGRGRPGAHDLHFRHARRPCAARLSARSQ